jgi:hypothetical protein
VACAGVDLVAGDGGDLRQRHAGLGHPHDADAPELRARLLNVTAGLLRLLIRVRYR